jgi:hypothetical protein
MSGTWRPLAAYAASIGAPLGNIKSKGARQGREKGRGATPNFLDIAGPPSGKGCAVGAKFPGRPPLGTPSVRAYWWASGRLNRYGVEWLKWPALNNHYA